MEWCLADVLHWKLEDPFHPKQLFWAMTAAGILKVHEFLHPAGPPKKRFRLGLKINGLVQGKIYRKAPYLMGKSMVSCRSSLKPIHWKKHQRWQPDQVFNPSNLPVTIPCPEFALWWSPCPWCVSPGNPRHQNGSKLPIHSSQNGRWFRLYPTKKTMKKWWKGR